MSNAKNRERREMAELAKDMADKMGEVREIWNTIENLGYQDQYIKQEVEPEYLNGLASRVEDLEENMWREWEEDDNMGL